MERLRDAFEAHDRKVEDLDLALFGSPMDADQARGRIEQGFDHLIFNLPSETADKVLPILDRCAGVVKAIRG